MGFSIGNSTLKYEILDSVSELQLLAHYFGVYKIPCLINSPFRRDNKPSLGIKVFTDGCLIFKDFATGECFGIYTALSKLWNISLENTYKKLLKEIPYIVNTNTPKVRVYSKKTFKKTRAYLECKVRNWEQYDLDYWESYGISLKWLKFGDIYPISHIIINGDTRTVLGAEKYAYAYVERKDGEVSLKIYQPKSIKKKWLNNHDASVWDLWDKLPETGENIIITSSRKDALCIWENTGIPTVSLQSETNLPKKKVVDQIKARFLNVFVLYDNDLMSEVNHGRILGKRIADTFGITQIEIPDEYGAKDISDLCKLHGRKEVTKLINKLVYVGNS